MSQFERDEFDEIATTRGPIGVHRKKRSPWNMVIAAVAVALLAGGLGFAWVVYLWRAEGNDGLPPIGDVAAPTITQTQVTEPTEAPSTVEPTPSETPEPTPTATVEPIRYDTAISVLNGAGVSGLAGRNAETLEGAGYTAVSAGNLTANKPAANVVRYADPIYEQTAIDVAAKLGISTVERGVTPDGSVTVLLVTNNLG